MVSTSDRSALSLIDGLFAGEKLSLSRAITAIENGHDAGLEILGAIQDHIGTAVIIGFTGPPGAGKSTLINAYIGELRRRGKTVAVIAVDPSSPISGGAILGDRIRMAEHLSDNGVFVRSLAARGHLGGLTQTTAHVIDLMDAAGWDYILLETVGAGQSEFEVAYIATTKVVISAPGLGDDVQAMKAGILEIADILVVNKADVDGAAHTTRQLRSMLGLRPADAIDIPVIETIATTGQGIDQLADEIEGRSTVAASANRHDRFRTLLARAAANQVSDDIANGCSPLVDDLCAKLQRGEINLKQAAKQIIGKF